MTSTHTRSHHVALVSAHAPADSEPVADCAGWLILSYQVPRSPAAPYMNIYRRLRATRVLLVHGGMAALPDEQWAEVHLRQLCAQINEIQGASASLMRADAIEGGARMVDAYNAERNAEYQQLRADAAEFLAAQSTRLQDDLKVRRQLTKLARRFEAICARDAFGADEQGRTAEALKSCRATVVGPAVA